MSEKQPKDQGKRDYASGLDGGLERSMLVEAGAGTGKTTILVNRIISILKQGSPKSSSGEPKPFKPERLVAITFTEKAAAELKARVREKLDEVIGDTKGSEKGLLQSAYDQLERAQITTIHGFALSLIKERPVEADISPVADIIDGIEKDKILEHCWERWLLNNLSDTSDESLEILFADGLPLTDLKKAADNFISERDIVSGVFDFGKPDIAGDFNELAASYERKLSEYRTQCSNPEDKLLIKAEEYSSLFRAAPSDKNELDFFILGLELPKTGGFGAKGNWIDVQSVRDTLADYRDRLDNVKETLLGWAASDVANRLNEYVAFYQDEKRKRGLLDFTDILIKCRDMLRDNRDVRRYFQNRFDYILVDEFQDTNPIQAEIAFYLAEEAPDADDWRGVELKPGKLFLVGDPKQSIYRFRRADIAIYKEAANLIGEKTDIAVNFRCRPSILDWVNRRFDPQMQGGEAQARYIPLHANREESEPSVIVAECDEDAVVRFNGIDDGKSAKDDFRRAEAAFIAGYVRRAVEEGLLVNERNGTARPAEYGDFALLFFSTGPISYYEEALHRAGIPYDLYRDKAYFGRTELNELVSIMRALVDPYDATAVVGSLRSSFFGASDNDLVHYRAAGGDFDYTRCDGKSGEIVAACFNVLRELRSYSVTAQPSQVIGGLFERTMNRPLYATRYGGHGTVNNLNHLLEIARETETSGVTTLPGLVRWFEKQSEVKDKGNTPASAGDSVILNTVHSAKGLEYNIVILPNLINGFQGVKTPGLLYYRDNESGELNLSLGLKSGITTPGYEETKKVIEAHLDAERTRLAYVAATRARDYLILPAFIAEKYREKSYAQYLLPEAGDNLDARVIDAPDYFDVAQRKRPSDANEDAPDVLMEYGLWEKKMSAAAAVIERDEDRIINPSALGHIAEAKRSEDTERGDIPRDMARSIGNALHHIMEHADFDNTGLSDKLVMEAVREFKCEPKRERVEELARNCLASPTITEARSTDEIYRELGFVYPYRGKLVEGVADLVYVIDEELYIVDYKSDDVTADEVERRARRYEPQMAMYATALANIASMRVAGMSLLFAAVPETVALSLPESP
ncbi:MAG: UvrD-helicase domain-containing protein [bacterium]|nr:UvrD-helicase domain-containing protein [bacterium]